MSQTIVSTLQNRIRDEDKVKKKHSDLTSWQGLKMKTTCMSVSVKGIFMLIAMSTHTTFMYKAQKSHTSADYMLVPTLF
jgi:hypothetical protein